MNEIIKPKRLAMGIKLPPDVHAWVRLHGADRNLEYSHIIEEALRAHKAAIEARPKLKDEDPPEWRLRALVACSLEHGAEVSINVGPSGRRGSLYLKALTYTSVDDVKVSAGVTAEWLAENEVFSGSVGEFVSWFAGVRRSLWTAQGESNV